MKGNKKTSELVLKYVTQLHRVHIVFVIQTEGNENVLWPIHQV